MNNKLSHITEQGEVQMVDVTSKDITHRIAVASGKVHFPQDVFNTLNAQGFTGKKGSIIQTAVIAGIQAAKRTSELIPLCHQLSLSGIDISINPENHSLKIVCSVKCSGQTGVEMEALTAVSVSALTIYDMCKAISHDIVISEIRLEEKKGGKSDFGR